MTAGKSPEEILLLAKEEGYELSEEELESIAGGISVWTPLITCPACHFKFERDKSKSWQKCPKCGEVFKPTGILDRH